MFLTNIELPTQYVPVKYTQQHVSFKVLKILIKVAINCKNEVIISDIYETKIITTVLAIKYI